MSIDHGCWCTYDEHCEEPTIAGSEFCWEHTQLVESPNPDEFYNAHVDRQLKGELMTMVVQSVPTEGQLDIPDLETPA